MFLGTPLSIGIPHFFVLKLNPLIQNHISTIREEIFCSIGRKDLEKISVVVVAKIMFYHNYFSTLFQSWGSYLVTIYIIYISWMWIYNR